MYQGFSTCRKMINSATNVPVKILSKLLGHANTTITYNIYIHLYGDTFVAPSVHCAANSSCLLGFFCYAVHGD